MMQKELHIYKQILFLNKTLLLTVTILLQYKQTLPWETYTAMYTELFTLTEMTMTHEHLSYRSSRAWFFLHGHLPAWVSSRTDNSSPNYLPQPYFAPPHPNYQQHLGETADWTASAASHVQVLGICYCSQSQHSKMLEGSQLSPGCSLPLANL